MKNFLLAFFILFGLSPILKGQDLPFEGMWKGMLSQSDKGLMYEIITKLYYESDSTLFGTSKIISKTGKYVEFYVEGSYIENQLVFTDIYMMKESGGTLALPWCIKKYFAEIILNGDKWEMKGEWSNPDEAVFNDQHLVGKQYCASGKFHLNKVKGFANATENDGDKVRYFQGRLVEIQEIVEINSDTLTLNFIDNNQIDNDTITVFFDKKLIVKQHGLTYESLSLPIFIDDEDEHLLIIYANNTGVIPPNTAAIYFFENGVKKEIPVRSDTSKSAGIIFKRKISSE
ncbi:MAG: hypothetical protein LC105_07940 [Chitinophagales bacterium]|nr:hypothetical protein [Chitinophagales bacterium]MCZ2393769.1 hypothetical protein [Chitinophagales bacterium]